MPDRTAARREEARIKRLSRADKLALLRTAQGSHGPKEIEYEIYRVK
jgi:predicted GIY-YIG superfamily endonuclease